MALRDQPYIPLYIKDILTDEKLVLCSPSAHGIYLRLLCILHKQKNYGKILLSQKFKINGNKCYNFASILAKQMPFNLEEIEAGLKELSDEDVIQISDTTLSQKRMIKDGKISEIRALAGQKGGLSKASKMSSKMSSKNLADYEYANEDEYEYVNENS